MEINSNMKNDMTSTDMDEIKDKTVGQVIDYTTSKMLGLQFYRYDENDEVDLIRVIGVKNLDTVKVLTSEGSVVKMKAKEIHDNYSMLKPDGLITISVVDMGKNSKGYAIEDVVVCLYTQIDLDNSNFTPACVCRQNITDFFANYLTTGETNNIVGVSVSRTSCPENIDYRVMTSCKDVTKTATAINIYIEDTIDSIIAMTKVKDYNRVLESCLKEHMLSVGKIDNGKLLSYHGYCRTLKQLLTENNFQFDFDSAFNILGVDVDIEENIEEVDDEVFGKYIRLTNYITNELSKVYKQNISDTIVVQYNHDISLDELSMSKYFILRDKKNLLYIVNYTTEGEYREVDLAAISAKDAMEKVKNIFTLNNDKYK